MAITDKFMHASSGTRPEPTTLASQKAPGAATLTADDLTGWATDTPTSFILYKVDTAGNRIEGTQSEWRGIVSGNTITQLTLTAGTDDTYAAGSAVIAAATADWGDSIVDGLLVSHNQDGTLKDNTVTTGKIADTAVTTAKLASGAVTPQKAANIYKFSATKNNSNGISSAGETVIFNVEDYDGNNNYDTTTGEYTAPLTGTYHFSAGVAINPSAASTRYIALKKNGTELKRGTRTDASFLTNHLVSTDMQLTAGDKVVVMAYASIANSNESSVLSNWFNGHLVSVG